jgi:hypothetical protein
MKYRFKPTESFWESFYDLSPAQKDSTRRAWKIFKENPFDPRLRTHKIHKLSAQYNRTIYAVDIKGDLRAVFFIKDDLVVTVDMARMAFTRVDCSGTSFCPNPIPSSFRIAGRAGFYARMPGHRMDKPPGGPLPARGAHGMTRPTRQI